MLDWLFGKKSNDGLLEIAKILKKGITINVVISGNINAKEERRDSLETPSRGSQGPISTTQQNQGHQTSETKRAGATAEEVNVIPDFKSLKKPEVVFGEEAD
jgi:hypothetical protein